MSELALVLMIGVLAVLAATGNLFEAAPALIVIQLGAVGLAVWARRSFPRDGFRVVATPGADTLVQRGPYRFIRHPMYSAALLLVWSGAIAHASVWTICAGALATGVVVVRIGVEERLLQARYASYAHYARATKALIPFVA